jgi:hypothetical protein
MAENLSIMDYALRSHLMRDNYTPAEKVTAMLPMSVKLLLPAIDYSVNEMSSHARSDGHARK